MKFQLKWAVLFAIPVAIALAAAPWTVSRNAQIDALKRQVRERAGLDVTAYGRSVFAVLPRPHIRIYEPRLRDESGGLSIAAGSLRVDLGFGGLTTGRVEIARAVLSDPVFTVDPSRPPRLVSEARDDRAGPGDVEIEHGRLLLRRGEAEQPDPAAEDIEARLEWSRADAPLSLTGSARIVSDRISGPGEDRGPTRFALWAAQPDRLGHGGDSPITLRLTDETFQCNVNGALRLEPSAHFEGQVSASTASLRTLALWLGYALPLPGPYRNLALKAEAKLNAGQLDLANLSLAVDGAAFSGAASVRLDGQKPSVAATLAGATVDFSPMFEDFPAAAVNGQWSRDSFAAPHLGAADLDLRLSATRARIGDLQLDNAALSVLLKNGRLDLNLAQGGAYSGVARARAVIAEAGAGTRHSRLDRRR